MASKFTRKDFLEALFGQYYRENRGFILVKSVKQGDPKMSTRYFPNVEILAREQYGEDRDVYFGTCPRERMKPEKEHVLWITALWANMDIGRDGHEGSGVFFEGPEQAAKAVRSFPTPPSIAVDSGRGLHLYWLLNNVTPVSDLNKMEDILKAVHDRLQCASNNGLDTVMRLPDTLNHKAPDRAVRCSVTFINTNFRYDLSDFENVQAKVHPVPQDRLTPTVSSPARSVTQPTMPPPARPAVRQEISPSAIQEEQSVLADDFSAPSLGQAASIDRGAADLLVPISESLTYVEQGHQEESPTMSGYSERRLKGAGVNTAPQTKGSSELARLAASRTEVEIALLGSQTVVRGILSWHNGGLIGVQTGEFAYTIPLSSVSFIRYRPS